MKTLDWRVKMLGHGTVTFLSYVQKRLKTTVASIKLSGTHFKIFIPHTFEKHFKPLARTLTDLYPIRSYIFVFRKVFKNTFIWN